MSIKKERFSINLVGGSSIPSVSRKRKLVLKSKAKRSRTDAESKYGTRGTGRSSR